MTIGPRTLHELEAGPNRQHIGSGHCTWTESHRDFARRVALIAVEEERERCAGIPERRHEELSRRSYPASSILLDLAAAIREGR